jgi:hypothetical protein
MISFKGTHFPKDVILYAVFFYIRYGVSYRDLEEIMEESGESLFLRKLVLGIPGEGGDKIKGHPTRRQVIWSQCSDPLLGRDEVTRTNRGAEGIGGRVKFLPLACSDSDKTTGPTAIAD